MILKSALITTAPSRELDYCCIAIMTFVVWIREKNACFCCCVKRFMSIGLGLMQPLLLWEAGDVQPTFHHEKSIFHHISNYSYSFHAIMKKKSKPSDFDLWFTYPCKQELLRRGQRHTGWGYQPYSVLHWTSLERDAEVQPPYRVQHEPLGCTIRLPSDCSCTFDHSHKYRNHSDLPVINKCLIKTTIVAASNHAHCPHWTIFFWSTMILGSLLRHPKTD